MVLVIKNSHFNLLRLLCVAKHHEVVLNICDSGITCDLYIMQVLFLAN